MPQQPKRRELSEQEFESIKSKVLGSLPDGLSEADFNRQAPILMEQALSEAEYDQQPEGSALGRFAANAAEVLNPITMAEGVYNAVRHPVQTAQDVIGAQINEAKTAYEAAKEGQYSRAAGHGLAAALPLVGPMAAEAGEQIASGDIAGGLGKGGGLLAPVAAVEGVRGLRNARAGGAANRANLLERQANAQVAERVLGPANPSFKTPAARIAPKMLDRKMKGGRVELSQAAEEGMKAAVDTLDTVVDPTQPVPALPIVQALEADLAELRVPGSGLFKKGYEKHAAELQARIQEIRDAATGQPGAQFPPYVKQPQVTAQSTIPYAELKRLRDLDYGTAQKAGVYQRSGHPAGADFEPSGWASGKVGSAIREQMAVTNPEAAAANADYTFYKTLADVLDPTKGRPKATGLPAGVTGGSRTVGAVVGSMTGSKAATLALAFIKPWLENVMASPEWQLADAAKKMELAKAIRSGKVGRARMVIQSIVKWSPAAGRTTSPIESRPMQEPAWSAEP